MDQIKFVKVIDENHQLYYDTLTHIHYVLSVVEYEQACEWVKAHSKLRDDYKRDRAKHELYLPFLETLYRICGRGF